MWGDVGRCGEMWGDVGRCGEMRGDVWRDMWGEVYVGGGILGDVMGDVMGDHTPGVRTQEGGALDVKDEGFRVEAIPLGEGRAEGGSVVERHDLMPGRTRSEQHAYAMAPW